MRLIEITSIDCKLSYDFCCPQQPGLRQAFASDLYHDLPRQTFDAVEASMSKNDQWYAGELGLE
jgi:hypothetical protein